MKSHITNALVAATALGVFLAIACEDRSSESGRPGTQLRDSAGIRIIENASPPEGSRLDWRIGPEPTLTIGEVDGEEPYLLYGATVFDPEGYALGFVETPEVFSIHEVGEDYILTWARDEMGVESVQLWPLDRGGG